MLCLHYLNNVIIYSCSTDLKSLIWKQCQYICWAHILTWVHVVEFFKFIHFICMDTATNDQVLLFCCRFTHRTFLDWNQYGLVVEINLLTILIGFLIICCWHGCQYGNRNMGLRQYKLIAEMTGCIFFVLGIPITVPPPGIFIYFKSSMKLNCEFLFRIRNIWLYPTF